MEKFLELTTGQWYYCLMIDQQLGEAPVRVEVAEDYSSFVITTTGQLAPIDSFLNTFPTSVASIAITVLPLLGVDPEQVSIRYIDGLSGTLMEERSLLEHLELYNPVSYTHLRAHET